MPNFLDVLAESAMKSIQEGYYETAGKATAPSVSLRDAILRCKRAPIISEIKFASPSMGTLKKNLDLKRNAKAMEEGGAVGISVLTEPKHFGGNLGYIAEVRGQVRTPILMKDIILSSVQVDAASKVGANAVLLIQTLFDRGYCERGVRAMVEYCHSRGLEALLEVHTDEEFLSASETAADMIGVNNRDLKTLEVDLEATKRILEKQHTKERVIVSESGINTPEDILFLKKCGAQAFLVGTAIMKAEDVKAKVRELVEAL
jgi:indole-3-glycerol phosphate synthase